MARCLFFTQSSLDNSLQSSLNIKSAERKHNNNRPGTTPWRHLSTRRIVLASAGQIIRTLWFDEKVNIYHEDYWNGRYDETMQPESDQSYREKDSIPHSLRIPSRYFLNCGGRQAKRTFLTWVLLGSVWASDSVDEGREEWCFWCCFGNETFRG